jgi:Domain of unknown function (DUF4136)
MNLFARVFAVALFGAAMAGAPIMAQTATIDYDHTVNFLKFKTYTWEKVHATDPGVEGRITIALNRDMGGRYMSEVSKGGDVTIAAVDATQDKQEFTTFYDSLGSDYTWQRPWGSGFMDSQATLNDIPVDTLIIDMYDTKSHKLLWRGTVTEPLSGSEDKKDNAIDKAVTLLISKYPPKYKK